MKKFRQFVVNLKRPQWIGVFLGFFCLLLIYLAQFTYLPFLTSFIQQLDFKIYDQMIVLNWHTHKPIPRVVVIDINEESIHQEGRWPWRRDKMADLLDILKKNGVVTIGLDIVMSEEETNYALGLKNKLQQLESKPKIVDTLLLTALNKIAPEVDSDRILAKTLSDHTVVLGFLFHNDTYVKKGKLPAPLTDPAGKELNPNQFPSIHFKSYNGSIDVLVNAAAQAGFVTNLPDSDGAIRKALIVANHDQKLYPSMALATAMNYLLVQHVSLVYDEKKLIGLQLDGTFVPTNDQGQILVPYWGKPGTLDYYSATDVLQHKVNVKDLQGSIAIIGSTLPLLADLHESPLTLSFPGVEIVANIVQAIVSQQLITPFDWHTDVGQCTIIGFGLFFTFLFPFINIVWTLAITLIVGFVLLAASVYLFAHQAVYVAIGVLLTLLLIQAIVNYAYSFILERQQKKHISHLFGQYVPEDYLKELIQSPDHLTMEGQTRVMTVLFADIRNFTSVSEQLDATHVKRLLNTFFTPITEIIFKNRGTIDKYVGDMIIAFWGAPIEDLEHARHALNSAMTIFDKMDSINELMKTNQLPTVQIGVGLATGLMNVGDMGSEFRRAYTVLGDTVNLASRLQDLTKFYKVNILVNELTQANQEEILWQTVDKVSVKGRQMATVIYQPLGLVSEASATFKTELLEYHQALELYYAQDWALAQRLLQQLREKNPHCYLYTLYLERIASFLITPPPADWDGVFVHLHK